MFYRILYNILYMYYNIIINHHVRKKFPRYLRKKKYYLLAVVSGDTSCTKHAHSSMCLKHAQSR